MKTKRKWRRKKIDLISGLKTMTLIMMRMELSVMQPGLVAWAEEKEPGMRRCSKEDRTGKPWPSSASKTRSSDLTRSKSTRRQSEGEKKETA